ncbi:MAG TPA: hypothetical protein VE079_15785 [Ensifer sp.]|nr:hypothetical protein [Ensifer sp.]
MKDKPKFIPADEVYRYLIATMEVYQMMSRHTGRTTAMLNAVKSGDCIIVSTPREREHFRHILAERRPVPDVEILVINPNSPDRPPGKCSRYGNVHFDHDWLFHFHQGAFLKSRTFLDFMVKDLTVDSPEAVAEEVREASHELGRFALHPRDRVWER